MTINWGREGIFGKSLGGCTLIMKRVCVRGIFIFFLRGMWLMGESQSSRPRLTHVAPLGLGRGREDAEDTHNANVEWQLKLPKQLRIGGELQAYT